MSPEEPSSPSSRKRPPARVDLWRRTLDQIPTLYGRLVYLTSLRNNDTGEYLHHGLALVFGQSAADQALRESHWDTFHEWLECPLDRQMADLDEYMRRLPTDQLVLLENWRALAPYRNLPPADANAEERDLFNSDLETVLDLLIRARRGGAEPPDA